MEKLSFKKLKSGSDVRGTAVGEDITLTDEAVIAITRAFVKWLSEKYNSKTFRIAVGNDSRISAERIVKNVTEALMASGCEVIYTGLSSTPSMFMLLKKSDFGCGASIMITASHLPYNKNGLKFFTPDGGLDGCDIDEILSIAEKGDFLHGRGKYCERSFMDEYSAQLVETVRTGCALKQPLKGLKIIVDAGNGAGGFFAEKVLKPLGADTTGSVYLEPDGMFPNHIPNPEDTTAMNSIKNAVLKSKADLGIIFDTDVDRAGAVDSNGEGINRNRLIALVSAILLEEKKGVIVTDSVTSSGLTTFIESLGGTHLRFKRGYKNVIDKCKELNEKGIYSPLAMETSGHGAFMDNYYLDDGAYLITRILISLAKQAKKGHTLTELISALPEPKEGCEIRLNFNENSSDFKAEGLDIIKKLSLLAEESSDMTLAPDNYEGVRINFGKENGDGWLLLRQSVHDPVLPINIESNTYGGTKIIAKKLYQMLLPFNFINIENLYKYIND
jgi:phosphomannomutase